MIVFFLLTFAASWGCYLAAAAAARAGTDGAGAASALAPVLLYAGTFAPSIVAVSIEAAARGRTGVDALLAPVLRWDVPVRWYVFALGYMPAIKLAATLGHRLISGGWPRFGEIPWYLLLAAVIVSTPVQAGEEIGWRGYAFPRLAAQLGFARASILLGIIWSVWHLPLFFIPGVDIYHQSFPLFLLAVTPLAVAMGWLYLQTAGSVLLTMVMHSAVNQTTLAVSAGSPADTNPFSFSATPFAWLTIAFLWIGAVWCIRNNVTAGSAARKAALPLS